jgi:hypothetical protein
LNANATHASTGSTDSLYISAFPVATDTAGLPASVSNGSAITFPAAGASWGNVIAFGLYDASSSGNLLLWDFLGNYPWLPFEIPTASAVLTVKGNASAPPAGWGTVNVNDPIVFSAEYGGTFPTLSTGTMTGYTINYVLSSTTDTINVDSVSGPTVPIVTTSSGSGMVRKIVIQTIPSGVTASFSAASLTATAA